MTENDGDGNSDEQTQYGGTEDNELTGAEGGDEDEDEEE